MKELKFAATSDCGQPLDIYVLPKDFYERGRLDCLNRRDGGVFGLDERAAAEKKDREFTSAEVLA